MNEQNGQPKRLAVLPSLAPSPLVSVVIPALNEERFIGPCLQSFVNQDYPAGRLDVIVADGGSTDATRAIVAEFAALSPANVRLVENPGWTTPQGLNAGIAAAGGEVIVIFGAHALAAPDFVSASVEALRTTGAAAVGGPIESRGDGPAGEAIAGALSNPFGVGDARFRFAASPGFVDTVAFAAYRRECFDVLGGFDTTRERAEDDFFNYEVRREGGRLYLTPAIRSTYFVRSSLAGVARQYLGYGRAKGRVAREEPKAISARHLVPSVAVVGGATLLLLSAVVQPARVVVALSTALYGLAALVAAFSPRRGHNRSLPARALTALVFPLLHVSYGVGMLSTIFRRPSR